ncbi:hypothetical protein ACHAWF_007094 [Thalassiosira exigua]
MDTSCDLCAARVANPLDLFLPRSARRPPSIKPLIKNISVAAPRSPSPAHNNIIALPKNNMMLRLAFLSLLAVGSNAFMTAPVCPSRAQQTARNLIMTEEEITSILGKAHGCVESECAVNDVEDLIAELKDQQAVLSERLDTVMNAVAHLQHVNEQEGRKTDDVRAIVRDMLRVFTTQDGKFAMGFSGDIGDGATTAYDALPPKPWKAPAP